MLTLDYLELTGFRSFVKRTRIPLAPTGLYLLASRNLDTGGSSGGGKSSVAMGINHAWGACEIPSTLLQSWGSKVPATSLLGLKDGEVTVSIQRGKKLDVKYGDDEPISGANGQKEERIRALFGGLDIETILALTYRGQRQPGLFLSRTDAEKKAFLTPVLGLDKFEQQAKQSEIAITQATKELVALDSKIEMLAKQMESLTPDASLDDVMAAGHQLKARTEERKARLEFLQNQVAEIRAAGDRDLAAVADGIQPKIDVHKARCASLRAELQRAKPQDDPEVVAEIARLEGLVSQCDIRIKKLQSEDSVRRKEVDNKRSEINKQIQARVLKIGPKRGLNTQMELVRAEIEKTTAEICPTCDREWDRACEHREKLQKRLKEIEDQLVTCTLAEIEADELRQELDGLPKFEPNPTIAKLHEASSKLSGQLATEQQKLKGAVALFQAERRKEIAVADAALSQVEAELEKEASRIMALTAATNQEMVVEMEAERRALSKDNDGLTELRIQATRLQTQAKQAQALADELAQLRGRRTVIDSGLRAEKDFAHLIGREGFLALIFDEVLQEISDETNDVLASVANTRHVTLQFRSENMTQKGEVSKEIKAVLTVHGNETSIKGGLSGGMLTTVELATDLAVGAVISRRSGVCPGWLVLDESFDGLDAVSKESCVEILQKYSKDRLVIVVDHASEMQGAFENVINVTYENGESRID